MAAQQPEDPEDPDVCTTCKLRWYSWDKHPPCLKLSPEERRERGALAGARPRVVEPPEETTYGDYQDAALKA